jgi:hypothetical protein
MDALDADVETISQLLQGRTGLVRFYHYLFYSLEFAFCAHDFSPGN